MPKTLSDAVLDGALEIINDSTRMTVCNAQPTTYTEAITTFKLAFVAMAGGDFVISNGDVDGRKVRMAAKAGVTIDLTGTAVFVALVKVSDTTLVAVTTCTSQLLTAGGTVDFPVWDVELADPV